RADVRDADHERDDRRHRQHERRRGDEDARQERCAGNGNGPRDDPYLRKTHEEVRRDRRQEMPDEGRCDHDGDVGRRSAEAAHDDRHERDEDRDVNATADRAECVYAEVSANARGRPVAIHARNRTLACQQTLPEVPRGGYLGSISWTDVRAWTVSTWSRAEAAAWSVPARPARPARPAGPAEGAWRPWAELGGTARAGCGGADDNTSIRIGTDRLGLHAGCVLHREVHDPSLVGQHRLERHCLTARLHARRHAAGDLAKLLLAASAVARDVEREVDRAPDPPRGDGRSDLLQCDEVLAAPADQGAQIRTEDLDAVVARAAVQRDLGLDTHQREQVAKNADARLEILGKGWRRLLALGVLELLAPFLPLSYRVRAAGYLGLVDHRLRLWRR